MEIKFEASDQHVLNELHQFIYQQEPELIVDEHYETRPGIHSEPIVTALIIRLTGKPMLVLLQKIITDYFSYKKVKEKEITIREHNKQKHQEDMLKISLNKDNKWEDVDPDKFDRLRLD